MGKRYRPRQKYALGKAQQWKGAQYVENAAASNKLGTCIPGLDLTVEPRLVPDSWQSPCLSLSPETRSMSFHAQTPYSSSELNVDGF